VTGEGRVNNIDVLLVRVGMFVQRLGIVIRRFDVDRDGDVDNDDLRLVTAHLGQVC
jgi:hypothetical protein